MKKIVSIMTLMLFAMVLNLSAQTVYVTENGKKYHQKDCQYAKDAKPMSLADAKAKGYTPCSTCCKDVKATDIKVYVTENGKKYHMAGCQYAKNGKEMSLADAKAKGYTPCSTCCKDAVTTPTSKDASKPVKPTPLPTDTKKK
jgi:fructose-specific component phosphotransferase system IIB-like protein